MQEMSGNYVLQVSFVTLTVRWILHKQNLVVIYYFGKNGLQKNGNKNSFAATQWFQIIKVHQCTLLFVTFGYRKSNSYRSSKFSGKIRSTTNWTLDCYASSEYFFLCWSNIFLIRSSKRMITAMYVSLMQNDTLTKIGV